MIRLWGGSSGVRFSAVAWDFSPLKCSNALNVPPGFFPAVKGGPGREYDHTPPSNADIKNEWSLTSTSPIGRSSWH